MAITDELTTIFKAPDLSGFVAQINAAQLAFAQLGVAEVKAKINLSGLTEGLAAFGASLGKNVSSLAQMAVAMVAVGTAFRSFGDDEQSIFRASVTLRNLGMTPLIAELKRFAAEMQKTIAIDDEAVLGIGALLAKFGVAPQQIEPAIKAIVDASKGGKGSIDEIGQAVGIAAATGQARGLRRLVGFLKLTGDEAHRTRQIIDALNRSTEGAGAAQRNTLVGTFQALVEAVKNLAQSIITAFSPDILVFLNRLIVIVNALVALFDRLGRLNNVFRPQRDPTEGIGSAPGTQGALERDAALAELRGIRQNTAVTADAIVKQVFGGSGTLGSRAANVRALRLALRSAG